MPSPVRSSPGCGPIVFPSARAFEQVISLTCASEDLLFLKKPDHGLGPLPFPFSVQVIHRIRKKPVRVHKILRGPEKPAFQLSPYVFLPPPNLSPLRRSEERRVG